LNRSLLWPFRILCGHLLYFVALWHMFLPFVILSPFWSIVSGKNLAALIVLFGNQAATLRRVILTKTLMKVETKSGESTSFIIASIFSS
jgi:hypothetical protein